MGAGGNGNNRWKLEGMGLQKIFPPISISVVWCDGNAVEDKQRSQNCNSTTRQLSHSHNISRLRSLGEPTYILCGKHDNIGQFRPVARLEKSVRIAD